MLWVGKAEMAEPAAEEETLRAELPEAWAFPSARAAQALELELALMLPALQAGAEPAVPAETPAAAQELAARPDPEYIAPVI